MVSDRSSRAGNWTDLRKMSMSAFLIRKMQKNTFGRQKLKPFIFRENKSLRSYTGHTQVGKKQNIRYNLIKFHEFNYLELHLIKL